MPRHSLGLLLGIAILFFSGSTRAGEGEGEPEIRGPLPPERAQEEFRVAPGLRVELVASEPEVLDPVAVAFDAEGRLWVVEMGDYPNGPPEGTPRGKIRILEDSNGDGSYDKNSIFADELLFANGLLHWKDGVLVTAAPAIVHLRDTNGDGKADRTETLYEGFATLNPQLRISHPTLGIDNWVYAANGLRGGQVVRSGDEDAEPIDLSGRDFRFDPVRDRAEAISGMGQFGLAFDDWGRRFVCDNRHHLRHVVMPDQALKRNPYLAFSQVLEDTSVLGMGEGGAGARIYPLSKNWTTSSLHVGTFTAACGVFVYRGDLLPEEFQGDAYTCDPTGNLIHRETLTPKGATFESRPVPAEGAEFLATPDDWFRPVSMTLGPDGAIYVVDMYRAVIEHPEWMPTELQERPDLYEGDDKGRIWRIVPESFEGDSPSPNLSNASTSELVDLLGHPNAWWRTTAQRLLLERQDASAVPALRELIHSSPSPLARVHAAWLLEGLEALEDNLVVGLLSDGHDRVRENAVTLADPRLTTSPEVQAATLALADDPDARVRFQVALALGAWDDEQVVEPLATIALLGRGDRWTRAAVAAAVPERAGALIERLLSAEVGLTRAVEDDRLDLLRELSSLVGSRRDADEVAGVLSGLLALEDAEANRWRLAALDGLAEGMGRRGSRLVEFLDKLPGSDAPDSLARQTEALLRQSAAVAEDQSQPESVRRDALLLLGQAPWEVAEPTLALVLTEDPSQALRVAAARALAAQPAPQVAGVLLEHWQSYLPTVRREVTSALLRRPERIANLLDAVESGAVPPGDLDAVATRQLVNSSQPEVRDRARALLQDNLPEERREVLERYQAAVEQTGDATRGLEIFRQNCATCHRVADVGIDVGPDIADTRVKTREALLMDILHPNQAIDGNYVNYVVVTQDGQIFDGIIAAETSSSLTLRRAEGQEDVILRQDLDELRSTGQSLMPEGLEQTITVEQMADLITFLKDWRYMDGDVPLGREE